MTLLAIDVGNSNTVFGIFDDGGSQPAQEPVQWRAATEIHRTGDEWLAMLSSFLTYSKIPIDAISGIVVGSVVPDVTTALRRMCARLSVEPLIVTWETTGGAEIRIEDPRQAGPDRIANAVAAYESVGGPAIVVDLGTATTLDVIGADGAYVGGVIMPGIAISLDALFDRAAALKRIELAPPPNVIGTSTLTAIQSGATYGYAAQVDGLCEQIEKQLGPCQIVSTGGLSGVITPLSSRIQHHDPTLTLRGLRIIYQRAHRSSRTT